MIGVFGGTFDPIHYGHLRPLWEVKEALQFEELRLIPCFIPPHRDTPGASPQQRLEMLRLAVADVPGFDIDERELRRGGPSFTVDTLQSLRTELAEQPLCWVMGLDAFLGLTRWHRWQSLLDLAHLVVAQRPGSDHPASGPLLDLLEEHQTMDRDRLHQTPAGLIYFQDVTQLDISATAIRQCLREGQDVRFLMPEPVRQYIVSNRLYKNFERDE